MSYFTTRDTFFVVPLDMSNGEIQKIDYLAHILEKSNVGKLIEDSEFKSSDKGRSAYNPYKLFMAIIYCFAIHKGTLRNIEEMCKYDLRVNYILGQETPSYKTIHEFINCIIKPNTYKIFTLITSTIITELHIDISNQYLDGTKIEANANKYKFVFKPKKHRKNLDTKIKALLYELDVSYIDNKDSIGSVEFNMYLKRFEEKEKIKYEDIKTSKGTRLSRSQKLIVYGYKCLNKLLEYEEKEIICGPNRNSYYRTDHDATAMALKTDYYSGHGSNMKAAYNVQFIVSSGIVTFFGVFQDRTDYYTLIPLLDKYELYYGSYPINLCADSGYGIFKNYEYLNKHNINNYIKFLNWNGRSNGKNPQLFFLNKNKTGFICLNNSKGKIIDFENSNHQKLRGSKLYQFEGCLDCPYEYKCREKIKDRTINYRKYELNLKEQIYREQAKENLLSIKGIEIRVNRSIQVEGTFGDLKQNLGYIRFRRRGLEGVLVEIMMMCLAINIRKLFSIYKKDRIESLYWKASEDTKPEEFVSLKPKKKAVTN